MRGDVRFWHLEWYGCYQWCSEGWNCRHHSASRWAPNQCQWTHCALEVPPLVKLSCTQASQLAGLKDVVIPVEVETSSMKISIQVRGGKTVEHTVRRRQYPVTTAYSFDYCSQGQTIPYIIVDITKPPSGTLTGSTCMLHFRRAQYGIPLDYFRILMRDYSYSCMTWISSMRMINWKNWISWHCNGGGRWAEARVRMVNKITLYSSYRQWD